MLKSILQTNIRTCAFRNGLATLWNKSTRKIGGQVPCTTTAGSQHGALGPSELQGHLDSFSSVVRCTPARERPNVESRITVDTLSMRLSRLCLSPEEALATVKYRLPPKTTGIEDAILDPVANVAIPLDCPTAVDQDFLDVPSHHRVDVFIGDPTPGSTISKKASNILQKRHRKMKRHQYKKWRKRNKFKLRIQKQRRRKKKRERWERHLSQFRFAELSASEKEQHLGKKEERLHIYLRYLGVQVDDIEREGRVVKDEPSEKKEERAAVGTGKLIPRPILPEGVPQR